MNGVMKKNHDKSCPYANITRFCIGMNSPANA